MKAIATLAALFCSVALSFAQENSGKVSRLSAGGPAATPISAPTQSDLSDSGADSELHLWDLIQKGGWAMIPLGGISVVTGMLVIGCFISLRKDAVASRQYLHTVEVLIRKKDYLGVLAISNRHGDLLARVVQRTLDFSTKNPGIPFESMKEVAEAEGSSQSSALVHRVAYLADIGIIAPMVGLFGTVLGIIRSFAAIGKPGASLGRDILLASGVSEALISTASGLIIAVVAAMFYAFFRNRAQAMVSELENSASYILGLLAASYQKRRESVHEDEI